jgi:hypothetical protein
MLRSVPPIWGVFNPVLSNLLQWKPGELQQNEYTEQSQHSARTQQHSFTAVHETTQQVETWRLVDMIATTCSKHKNRANPVPWLIIINIPVELHNTHARII